MHSKTCLILCDITSQFKDQLQKLTMLTQSSDKENQKNCNKIKPIVDKIIFFWKVSVPFRDYKDDSGYHSNFGEY